MKYGSIHITAHSILCADTAHTLAKSDPATDARATGNPMAKLLTVRCRADYAGIGFLHDTYIFFCSKTESTFFFMIELTVKPA